MKKIFITSALAILLIAGYVVGQAQFSNDKSVTSGGKPYGVQGTTSGGSSESGLSSERDSSSPVDPNYATDGSVVSKGTSSTVRCVKAPCPTDLGYPVVGDPKGTAIIKSGTVEITIARDALNKIKNKLNSLMPEGGYVESSHSSKRTSTITLRIPATQLDDTLVSLRKLGSVTAESIESYDRSYDAIDYDARLKNMREREAALNVRLAKATPAEAVSIEEQILNLRSEIDSLQGQKDLLTNQVALSTLTVTLTEKGTKADQPGEKSMLGKAWTTSADALLSSTGGILIVFTAILPFLLIGLVLVQVIRAVSRRNKNVKMSEPEKEPSTEE